MNYFRGFSYIPPYIPFFEIVGLNCITEIKL